MSSKKQFLKQRKHDPYRLNVSDYRTLVPYFFNKYQIDLPYVVNGSTALGRRMVAQNYLDVQAEIEAYQNEELVYAQQVIENWSPPGTSLGGKYRLNQKNTKYSDFQKYYPELYAALKDEFLDTDGRLKALSDSQRLMLNKIVKGLKCHKKLDEYRREKLDVLYKRKNQLCLNKYQAIEEVKSIQASLAEGESVVYFFTNNHSQGSAHFEVLLIKRDQILKPVHWFLHESNIFDSVDFNNMFVTDLSPFITFEYNESVETLSEDPMKRLQPQVDTDSCGVLGLLYLKELLKNNSKQLEQFSFTVPVYSVNAQENSEEINHKNLLFFPSPHVLRYSQSRLYNNILLAMMQSTNDEEVIQYKNISYKVKTLHCILKESITIARQNGDPEVTQLEKLWVNLPDFREKWLKAYQEVARERQEMQGKSNNLFLAYKGNCMKEIVNNANKSTSYGVSSRQPTQKSAFPTSETVVTYNPMYEASFSTCRVQTYRTFSFFKPQERALVGYNPLYKSAEEERMEITCS